MDVRNDFSTLNDETLLAMLEGLAVRERDAKARLVASLTELHARKRQRPSVEGRERIDQVGSEPS